MNIRCLGAKVLYGNLSRTRCQIIQPVRLYQKFRGPKRNTRNNSRDSNPKEKPLSETFSRAKLIEVPFQADAPEVTLADLQNNGLISKFLHNSILDIGFKSLTPVQQKSIGPILENESQDVITRAKTGTGKTFAFLIPMFQHLINTKREDRPSVKFVIVAPTRDLAFQINAEAKRIQKQHPVLKRFRSLVLVGGTNFASGVRELIRERPKVVIGTPGRLLDVISRYQRSFNRVDVKVLDEADRLLEIGFQQDLEKISNVLNEMNEKGPNHMRTLLFSATLDAKVQDLSQNIMGKDECLFLDTVDKNEPQAHEKIAQSATISENLGKSTLATLDHIKKQVRANSNYKAILFTPTIKFTTLVSDLLKDQKDIKVPILEFHGRKDQKARSRMVQNFKRDTSGILVCTDVAARGLDFPDIAEVLQIGVPSLLPQYIHRIGRTARAGKTGKATLFISEDEAPFLQTLAKEAHIFIKDQHDYQPDAEALEKFASNFKNYEELNDALISTIAYYRSNARNYGFNDRAIVRQIAGSYGTLLNDKKAKLPISSNTLEKLGLKNIRSTSNMFDVHESLHGKPRGRDTESNNYEENGYRGRRGRRERRDRKSVV